MGVTDNDSPEGSSMKSSLCAVVVLVAGGILAGCGAEDKEVGAVGEEPVTGYDGPRNLPLGAPCQPSDESLPDFSAFDTDEINFETGHAGCASGVCLLNHFQGRVSCPYGQAAPGDPNQLDSPPCLVLDGSERVAVEVAPQLVNRRAEDVATCSCRCASLDGTGPVCPCPIGFECVRLLPFSFGPDDPYRNFMGSYCIKAGTAYDSNMSRETCDWETQSCGPG
jgi:hypothetical protein